MATGRPQPKGPTRSGAAPRPSAAAPRSPQTGAPAKPTIIKTHWAEFKEPTPGQQRTQVEADPDWSGDDVVRAGDFHPTPVWDSPGAKIEGIYLGMSENRGPNNQRMYHFRHPEEPTYFDVWGAKALDDRFNDLLQSGRLETGYLMRITYLGDVETKRGQNPAHTFEVLAKTVSG